MKTKEEIIAEMQEVVEQMRLDDIEENPDCEFEYFTCNACGDTKSLAGSVQYGPYRLCNDCVLYAEVGFELGQIKTIEDNGTRIVMCHYPMVEWDGFFRGALHFYGHIHILD